MSRVNVWAWAVAAWICVIFFSSTSLASLWAEQSFRFIAAELMSTLPEQTSSDSILHLLADKGFHVSLFFLLAILLWKALSGRSRRPWTILLAGAFVGSCSEYLQSFFPDRDPALRDVAINIGGTALGLSACLLVRKLMAGSERRQLDSVIVEK